MLETKTEHKLLLDRLDGTDFLFWSCLKGRGYVVAVFIVTCGVPEGSILVPLLFNLCMLLPTGQIINEINIAYRTYSM